MLTLPINDRTKIKAGTYSWFITCSMYKRGDLVFRINVIMATKEPINIDTYPTFYNQLTKDIKKTNSEFTFDTLVIDFIMELF